MGFYMNMGINESSGSSGLMGRIAQAKYETEKKKNDKHDAKVEKKYDQYKRAGYEDKAPTKADRTAEKRYKDLIDDDKDIRFRERTGRLLNRQRKLARDYYIGDDKKDNSLESRAKELNTRAAADIAEEYERRKKENEMTENKKELHDRINKRAAAKHECSIFDEAVFIDE